MNRLRYINHGRELLLRQTINASSISLWLPNTPICLGQVDSISFYLCATHCDVRAKWECQTLKYTNSNKYTKNSRTRTHTWPLIKASNILAIHTKTKDIFVIRGYIFFFATMTITIRRKYILYIVLCRWHICFHQCLFSSWYGWLANYEQLRMAETIR